MLSYTPYTKRPARPAIQSRTNRYFVLIEGQFVNPYPVILPPVNFQYPVGQLVVYDSTGQEDPRVVYPADGSDTLIDSVAAREDSHGRLCILAGTIDRVKGMGWHLSADGGATWVDVALPPESIEASVYLDADSGGPVVRQLYSKLRIGNDEYPFAVAMQGLNAALYGVRNDGTIRAFLRTDDPWRQLCGSDREGARFIVRTGNTYTIAGAGGTRFLGEVPGLSYQSEGWITPDGSAYVEVSSDVAYSLWYLSNGIATQVVASLSFEVPTADFAGAWIATSNSDGSASLRLHTPTGGLVEQWSLPLGIHINSLIAGRSGGTLLVDVVMDHESSHPPGIYDQGLAVWHAGEPAPKSYDALYIREAGDRAFVHADPDKLESGEPFVYSSGPIDLAPGSDRIPLSLGGGGGDIVQEWGVVRASLLQELVFPGIGRIAGAFGSLWRSDVLIENPNDTAVAVRLRYQPVGALAGAGPIERIVTIAPNEIRILADVVYNLFGLDSANGALFMSAPIHRAVNATSRTYTTSLKGTYGFGMDGRELASSVGPRFPISFSGAVGGSGFRTNLFLIDGSGNGSGRGAEATWTTAGAHGLSDQRDHASLLPGTVQQFNGTNAELGEPGAVLLAPSAGSVIAAAFMVDDKSNDPTHVPPDLSGSYGRTIPAVGHVEGAYGSMFRSDLFLLNPSPNPGTILLRITMWDSGETSAVTVTMAPHEARTLHDFLFSMFGKSGVARLQFDSWEDSEGVRVTSRTYSTDSNGGTYGFLMPPLTSLQTAVPGAALQILGPRGGAAFRTNLGLVVTDSAWGAAEANVEIFDESGLSLDHFHVTIPSNAGTQINDVFRTRGLGDGPAAALIRVTPTIGSIGAYATSIDNGTNDPTYFAANLATH